MRNFAFLAISASLMLSLAACGDDDDDTTTADAMVIIDAVARVDSTPRIDASTLLTGLDCQGVLMCGECCADDTCFNACVAAGTTTAQAALTAINDCINEQCGTDCAGGASPACSTCQTTNCATAIDGCSFEATGTENCASLAVGTQGCDEYLSAGNEAAEVCLSQTENPGLVCYEDLFQAASQTALNDYFALVQCINTAADTGGTCATDCGGSDENACTTCLSTACGTQLETCGVSF